MAQVTSGYCYSSYGDDSRYYVYWKRTDIWNETTCGSELTWELYLDNHNWWYTNALKVYPVYINGVCVYNGGTFSNKTTYGAIKLASGTTKIQHDNDGTKKFNINFTGWFYSSTNVSGNTTFELETIPRASSFGDVEGITMGSNMTIDINSNSDNFTHSLWYSFGTKTWQAIGSGLKDSATFKIPLTLANEIPNDTYGAMTLILRTYNGTTQVGNDQTVAYKVYVPSSVVPSISEISVSEATNGLATQFATYVQYKSKLKVAVTAAGSYGSTIKSYNTTVNGTKYKEASFTTGAINTSGKITITTTVTDSRGRTATDSEEVNITAYYDPKATTLEAARCNSDGTLNNDGTYVKLTYKYDIASVNSKNSKSAKIQYLNGSTWTDISGASFTAYTGNSSTVPTKTFSVDTGWQFRLVVSDYFGPQYNYAEVSTGFTLMNYNADGTGIGFGKVSEKSNAVEFGLAPYVNQTPDGSNIPTSGIITDSGGEGEDFFTKLPGLKTFIGSTYHKDKTWYNVLSIKHRNGAQDGNRYGMAIWTRLSSDDSLSWGQYISDAWKPSKIILDSSNYTNYAFPKSGGSIQCTNTSGIAWPLTLHQIGNTNSTGWGAGIKFLNANDSSSKWAGIGGIAYSNYANENGLVFYANASDTARMRSDRFIPTANGSTYLGDSSHKWKSVYTDSIVLNGTDMMTQNVLWSGGHFMNESQTATLSQAVTAQRNGIVLIFSKYDGSAAVNQHFHSYFVPKQNISTVGSSYGQTFHLADCIAYRVGYKTLFIHDTKIVGIAENDDSLSSGYADSGIKYNNALWVMRYVIGV